MKCKLCNKTIENYNPKFNHLEIDEKTQVDICSDCTDKFLKWQQSIFADLFPTKSMKKRYGKE